MKINFTQKIKAFDGREIAVTSDGTETATLGWVVIEALMHAPDAGGGARLSGNDIIGRHKLAARIHGASEPIEVTVEDAALIKRLIPERWQVPAIAAPALLAMDDQVDAR